MLIRTQIIRQQYRIISIHLYNLQFQNNTNQSYEPKINSDLSFLSPSVPNSPVFNDIMETMQIQSLNEINLQEPNLCFKNITIELTGFVHELVNVTFINCSFIGIQEFECANLSVVDCKINWVRNVQNLMLSFSSIENMDLKTIQILQPNSLNLTNIEINQKLIGEFNVVQFRRCVFKNLIQINAKQATFSECALKTSQLMSSNITRLDLDNVYEGSENSYKYYYPPLETIVDDLPNTRIVNIHMCTLKLHTFARPRIQYLRIIGDVQLIPLLFYTHVELFNFDNTKQQQLKEVQRNHNDKEICNAKLQSKIYSKNIQIIKNIMQLGKNIDIVTNQLKSILIANE
ncbi:Hypothetical_protein [Hexamita inflata]|uniref:Hypothetical_protein n=1 Tax=Hexamita inflata TaxID=28002 RepID=A0AA86RKI8_9EUKA|nr:Hypothetical protein HINF_LOCUS61344 [Hexamita inflata]